MSNLTNKYVYKVLRLNIFLLIFPFLPTSCSLFYKPKNEWIKTQEGISIYGNRNNPKAEYSWKGETLSGIAHGKGTLYVVDDNGKYSDHYTGIAIWGTLSNKNWKDYLGGKFLGEMDDNKPQGFGVLKKGNVTYLGNFDSGILNGKNASIFIDTLLQYKGDVKNSIYDGEGVLYKNGQILYRGEFKNGVYDGTGTLYRGKLVYYTGGWKDGKYHGKGKGFIQKGNLTYRGVIIDGKIDDTDAFLYKNNILIFKGGIKDGKYNGQGVIFENGHVKYKGNFVNGKYDGNGILYKDDVVYYNGEWENGVFDGKGVLYADGQEIHGTWSEGHLDDNSIVKQLKRSYNIITNNEELNDSKPHEDDSKYINNSIFFDSLSIGFTSMIKNQIKKNVEDRFNMWNLPRMLWQTLFTKNSRRMVYAQNAFTEGLSAEEIQIWINTKIRQYNNVTEDTLTLHYAKMKSISKNEIVGDKEFKLVNDREWLEWDDIEIGEWIGLILNFIIDIVLLITLQGAGCLVSIGKNILIMCIVFFVVDIHEPSIEEKITNEITENYINYIENQNLENQIYHENEN